MRRLLPQLIALAAVGYAGYLGYNYWAIRLDLEKNAAVKVVPKVADDEASEAGYIFDMRRETYLRRVGSSARERHHPSGFETRERQNDARGQC